MRIAVCFSGQVRTGVDASPNLLRFIGELLPYTDFFVHTWDTETISKHALNGRDISISENVYPLELNKIKELKNIYKPKDIKIDNVKDYSDYRANKILNENNGILASLIPMFHSIYECNQLKINYEKQNKIKYDFVIKMRFDIIFDTEHTLLSEIEHCMKDTSALYTCDYWNKLPMDVEDICWISSSTIMDIMCDFLLERETDIPMNHYTWQTHSKIYLDKFNIPVYGFKNNKLYIYREYHLEQNISPIDTHLL